MTIGNVRRGGHLLGRAVGVCATRCNEYYVGAAVLTNHALKVMNPLVLPELPPSRGSVSDTNTSAEPRLEYTARTLYMADTLTHDAAKRSNRSGLRLRIMHTTRSNGATGTSDRSHAIPTARDTLSRSSARSNGILRICLRG